MKTGFIRLICIAVFVSMTSMPMAVHANKPLKKTALSIDSALAYVVVKVSSRSKMQAIYINRIDSSTGELIWKFEDGSQTKKENFDVAMIGPNAWHKTADGNYYVIAVNPGFWTIGGVEDALEVTALSMGSYGFEAKAGRLTYIGTITAGKENGRSPDPRIAAAKLSPDLIRFGTLMNIVMSGTIVLDRPTASDKLPDDLPSLPVVIATITDDVRFNNAFRGLVSRAADLPPIRPSVP